jgi:hypothetical protein
MSRRSRAAAARVGDGIVGSASFGTPAGAGVSG